MHSDVIADRSPEKLVEIHHSPSHQRASVLRRDHKQIGVELSCHFTNAAAAILSVDVDGFHIHSEITSALHCRIKNLVRFCATSS